MSPRKELLLGIATAGLSVVAARVMAWLAVVESIYDFPVQFTGARVLIPVVAFPLMGPSGFFYACAKIPVLNGLLCIASAAAFIRLRRRFILGATGTLFWTGVWGVGMYLLVHVAFGELLGSTASGYNAGALVLVQAVVLLACLGFTFFTATVALWALIRLALFVGPPWDPSPESAG